VLTCFDDALVLCNLAEEGTRTLHQLGIFCKLTAIVVVDISKELSDAREPRDVSARA